MKSMGGVKYLASYENILQKNIGEKTDKQTGCISTQKQSHQVSLRPSRSPDRGLLATSMNLKSLSASGHP